MRDAHFGSPPRRRGGGRELQSLPRKVEALRASLHRAAALLVLPRHARRTTARFRAAQHWRAARARLAEGSYADGAWSSNGGRLRRLIRHLFLSRRYRHDNRIVSSIPAAAVFDIRHYFSSGLSRATSQAFKQSSLRRTPSPRCSTIARHFSAATPDGAHKMLPAPARHVVRAEASARGACYRSLQIFN